MVSERHWTDLVSVRGRGGGEPLVAELREDAEGSRYIYVREAVQTELLGDRPDA